MPLFCGFDATPCAAVLCPSKIPPHLFFFLECPYTSFDVLLSMFISTAF